MNIHQFAVHIHQIRRESQMKVIITPINSNHNNITSQPLLTRSAINIISIEDLILEEINDHVQTVVE